MFIKIFLFLFIKKSWNKKINFPKKIIRVNGQEDKIKTEDKVYKNEFIILFFLNKLKKNMMFKSEKKTTKLWGLISDDCQIRNKLKEARQVVISEFLWVVKIFVK